MSMDRPTSPAGPAAAPVCVNPDVFRVVQNLEALPWEAQKEFDTLADNFFSSPKKLQDTIFAQIAARAKQLGKPLLRLEVRDLYLHTLKALHSWDYTDFIDALNQALDRAEAAGNLRPNDPDVVQRVRNGVTNVLSRARSLNPFVARSPNVALDVLPQPKKASQGKRANGPKTFLIAMPGVFKEKKDSDAFIRELRGDEPTLQVIGNGFDADLQPDALLSLRNAHPEAAIHVFGHGSRFKLPSGDNAHGLGVARDRTASTKDLFISLRNVLGEEFVGTVHLYSCYSATAIADAGSLPKGTVLITYTEKDHPGLDVLHKDRIKANIASANQPVRFSRLVYPDTLIFRDNSRNLMCSIPPSPSPLRTPAALKTYVQQALRHCNHPEIIAAANQIKLTPAQLQRYQQEAFIVHAVKGNLDSLREYLASGLVDINGTLPGGVTALFMASEAGTVRSVEWLLSRPGIDPKKTRKDKSSPLFIAAQQGHTAVVRALLADGRARPNLAVKKNGATPLMMAAQNGHEDVVRALLGYEGTSLSLRDREGQDALMHAVKFGREAIVRLLLADGRADPRQTRNDGASLLDIATQENHKSIVHLLLADGRADPNFTKSLDGSTPLFRALDAHDINLIGMILADKRTDPTLARADGALPLFRAIDVDHPQKAKGAVRLFLLNARVDPNQLSSTDSTPLIHAAQFGRPHVVRQLLDHRKTQPNQGRSSDGMTALHTAVYLGRLDVVKVLAAHPRVNLEPKTTTPPHATPLFIAQRNGHKEIAKVLEQAIKDRAHGRTAERTGGVQR